MKKQASAVEPSMPAASRPAQRLTRRAALAAIAALPPVLAGCGARGRDPHAMTVLVGSEPEQLDPRFPGDALGSTISRLVYAGLLDSDPVTYAPTLSLAESVEAVDDHTVHVVVRAGARFNDDTPLTARDVAASYQAILDPDVGSTLRETFSRVFDRVRALDERRVEFALTGPDGSYPSLLQHAIVRARDALSPRWPATPGHEARFVGAGPMRVTSLARGAWQLERIAPSTDGRARALRFLTMHDPNTLALRLLHGAADTAEIKPELFPIFDGHDGYRVERARSVGFSYVGLRNDHPALALREVRQALAYAIDRDALREGKFGRFALASTGPLPPWHWAYAAPTARYAFDPERARALLDRVLPRPRAGAPRTRLVLRATSVRFTLTIARAVAEMLAAVGIEVDVRPSDLATLLPDLRAGRYDLTVMTMPDLSDPWGIEWLFATRSMPSAANAFSGGNRWRFSNAAFDDAVARGRRAFGEAARKPHYAAAQQILADELPVLPLWHADVVYAAGARVRSLRPRGDAQLGFLLDASMG